MTTKQLLDKNNQQIKSQDKEIEKLVGVAKMGNKTAKYVGDQITDQNKKLDNLGREIEVTEEKMVRTRGKFDEFLERSSFCCLYIIIIVLLVLLFLVIFIQF